MKYIFMRDHREAFPVSVQCQTLGVGRSGFYAWLNRALRTLVSKRTVGY
jgi:hypothetical protein